MKMRGDTLFSIGYLLRSIFRHRQKSKYTKDNKWTICHLLARLGHQFGGNTLFEDIREDVRYLRLKGEKTPRVN